MYKTILMPLDGTPTDRAIIEHIKQLATLTQSRIVLLHVATGVPAQYHGSDAAGKEIDEDRAYLLSVCAEFEALSIPATAELAFGNPAKEILQWIERNECDLVAMSTHGHQFVGDLVYGTTASRVQHRISVPVLLLRAKDP